MSQHERENTLGNRRDEESVTTLYVNNLPVELNEDGIAQIFESYGEVCSLYTPPDAGWAYVSYKTYKEAEHAIRALNERPPLDLKVAFRKKSAQSKTEKYVSSTPNDSSVDTRDYSSDCRYVQRGLAHNFEYGKIAPGALAANVAQMASCKPPLNGTSVYPCDIDHTIYNPYENVGRFADTNAMWSRGRMTIDEYGKRHVSMGRGYTYQIPEPYPGHEQDIRRVFEKRRAGFYQHGNDALQHAIGKCQYCAHIAKLRCARCNGFYCSRECQVADWPCHKIECKIIPALIGDPQATCGSETIVSYSSTDEQFAHVARRPRGMMESSQVNSLRRPKRVLNLSKLKIPAETEVSNNEISIENASPKKSPHKPEIKKTPPKENEINPIVKHSPIKQNSIEQLPVQKSTKKRNLDCLQENKNQCENANDRNKENTRPDPFAPDHKSTFRQSYNSRGNESRSISVTSGGTIDSKTDYKKMEEELAFQREPKIQVNVVDQAKINVANQAPVRCDSALKTPTLPQEEKSTIVKLASSRLPKETFIDVQVTCVMPDSSFWVFKKEDETVIEKMMLELTEKADNYPKATKLTVGSTYAIKYEDIWHRVTLVATKPTPSVLYVDFGNIEPPQSDDFRSLDEFTPYPAFAIHLRFSQKSSLIVQPDEELSVKMTGIDKDDVFEVIIKEELKKVEQPSSSISQVIEETIPVVTTEIPDLNETIIEDNVLKSTIEFLKVGSEGYAQVYMTLDNNSYAVCVLSDEFMEQYEMIYETLTQVCNSAKRPDNWNPQIGDFVCGKRDDFWVRGHVFSLGSPIRLALVDEARIAQVDQILPMPAEYEKICFFGAICSLDVPGAVLNVDETPQFKVVGIKKVNEENVVNAVLVSPERLKNTAITMKGWKPTPEQKGIGFAELKNNGEVCITAYSSERIMYVRSLDIESLERTQRILQNVAKWAQTAPKLSGPPAIGQLVIAKFSDGNFYRAIVTMLQDDNKIGVSYIDYGNRELTTIDNLRLLSDELKEHKACMSKVILKGIQNDVVPTKDVHQFLDILVGREQPLICTFEGIPSKDGVTLTTASGESVNDKINALLVPSWQREDPSKNMTCFMIDHLPTATLGEVGDTVQAIVLFATDPPFKYVMSPFDREHLAHVTTIMPELMFKYCESRKQHYIPRTDELCLAPYEGGWYRGACLNHNETPTQALIYFVDFGNIEIIDHTNIREMTKEFMSPSSLGISCIVKNLGVELVNGRVPDNVKRRIEELVQPNELIAVKILKKTSLDGEINGDYEVELPTVREKLIAEGLIKP